jgi:hypothetical protein
MTSKTNRIPDMVIHFEDATIRSACPALQKISLTQHILNGDCTDISKERVERIFKEVFGYGTHLDPKTHIGDCVRKSNANAMQDGTIITCPIVPEPGYIYQRLIENNVNEKTIVDHRVYIMKNTIPLVLNVYTSPEERFIEGDYHEEIVETDNVFSKDEQSHILAFTKKFGLEYGELDVLRDRKNGRIYIIDANNTPYAPRRGREIDCKLFDTAFTTLSHAFHSMCTNDES